MDQLPGFQHRASSTSDEEEFMGLTEAQRKAIQTTERVGASLSLVGVVFIFITFAAFKRLRTVPNTFILFASIANVGASIACLIGYAGLFAGYESALCQVQAFLLEMFMQSDPWWSLAMAVNVYMVFFLAASPDSFRKYLWLYNLICFGAPALPALVCLIMRKDDKGIYGNATLWCWIDDNWSSLRIFTYYMPIWICILLSAVIYFAVGYQVFHQRNQLRNLTLSNPGKETSGSEPRNSGDKPLATQPGSYATVVTEVQVRTECSEDIHLSPPSPTSSILPSSPSSYSAHQHQHQFAIHPWTSPSEPASSAAGAAGCPASSTAAYVTVSSISSSGTPGRGGRGVGAGAGRWKRSRGEKVVREEEEEGEDVDEEGGAGDERGGEVGREEEGRAKIREAQNEGTGGGGGRGRGFLFLFSLPFPFLFPFRLGRGAGRRVSAKLRNLDPVKLAYLRTSFVFAISVLVTWTPSSINRVYTLVYPQRFNFGLNMASAVVLPLQGVWNAVIYGATSWVALRDETADLRDSLRRLLGGRHGRHGAERLPGGSWSGSGPDPWGPGGSGGGGGSNSRRARRFGSNRGRRRSSPPGDGQDVEMKSRVANVRVFRGGSF